MEENCETRESCFQKMRKRIKDHLLEVIGAIVGGIGGFIYYHTIGCSSGACPIKSNPWLVSLWGKIMGYLIVGIFNFKRKS